MTQPIPAQFRSDGFDFRLVSRDGTVALFAKQKGRIRPSFEVVLIQVHPAECIFGNDLPEREVMPVSESWGTAGWSYGNLADAQARFRQLCKAQRKGHFQPKGFAASASKRSPGLPAAGAMQNSPTTP